MTTFHPGCRSAACTFAWSLDDDLRLWDELGIDYVAVALPTMDARGLRYRNDLLHAEAVKAAS